MAALGSSPRRWVAIGALAAAILASDFAQAQTVVPGLSTPPGGVARYAVAPTFAQRARENVVTWDGTDLGVVINSLIGADTFLNNGIWGQYSAMANVEAGHIWNGHETLTKVTDFYTPQATPGLQNGALGEFDMHATAVGMIMAGLGPPVPIQQPDGSVSYSYYYYQMGIAPMASLSSGAIATHWYQTPWGSFDNSDKSYYDAYYHFFTGPITHSGPSPWGAGTLSWTGPADVINSSWGGTDPTGTGMDPSTVALDGLARKYPQTTLVLAAGNSGPAQGTVGGPASGYNAIVVGATGDGSLTNFSVVADFSSRGPQDYEDPVHGVVPGVRAAVSLVAPGTSLATAYYGGNTGSNRYEPSDSTNGANNYYTVGAAGTSFAAPMVAGGVALLNSLSYTLQVDYPWLYVGPRDARVFKAVLMNSADKLPGWDNGQHTEIINSTAVTVTRQSLDWSQGAGQINLTRAFDDYFAGILSFNGYATNKIAGWYLGTISPNADPQQPSHQDFYLWPTLSAGKILDVTLAWFRYRGEPSLVNDENGVPTLQTSDLGFANLDLEIWDYTFSRLYATSMSTYNDVEHLHFVLPQDGDYAVRVVYNGQVFGEVDPLGESYGLAWAVIPEPGTLLLLLVGAGTVLLWRARLHLRRGRA